MAKGSDARKAKRTRGQATMRERFWGRGAWKSGMGSSVAADASGLNRDKTGHGAGGARRGRGRWAAGAPRRQQGRKGTAQKSLPTLSILRVLVRRTDGGRM
jgi:hypothetical protein